MSESLMVLEGNPLYLELTAGYITATDVPVTFCGHHCLKARNK